MTLYLYRIHQSINNGYDTYDSAVVIALNADDARTIYPGGGDNSSQDGWFATGAWVPTEDVEVEYLGRAASGHHRGVVCASFNAG
jgi:hypothetical protein